MDKLKYFLNEQYEKKSVGENFLKKNKVIMWTNIKQIIDKYKESSNKNMENKILEMLSLLQQDEKLIVQKKEKIKTEFETKILNIEFYLPENLLLQKLLRIGATKKNQKRLMRRYVYDINPQDKTMWIRLRDEGDRTTLTMKKIIDDSIEGVREIEIDISDFDEDFNSTNLILNKLGFKHTSYQENNRTSFILEGVEIEIDHWPQIPPYLEIEGSSRQEVERVVNLLGFDLSQTTSVNTTDVYKQYGINLDQFDELRF